MNGATAVADSVKNFPARADAVHLPGAIAVIRGDLLIGLVLVIIFLCYFNGFRSLVVDTMAAGVRHERLLLTRFLVLRWG